MKIAELFARLGVKADTPQIKGFSNALNSAKSIVVTTTGDILKFVSEIKNMTDEMFDAAAAFKQFEAETGASSQELQKWQAVAEQTNNSAESVANAIKAITSNQEKIRLGQGDISGYQLLGIDPRQDPFKILDSLREKTSGLTQAMKKNILSQMGVGSELIQVLELSNEKFKELSSNAFVIPANAIEQMNQAKSSMNLLGNATKWLKSMIAAELSPGIVDLNKKIATWIRNNKEGLIKTLKTVFDWTSKFTSAVMNAGMMINQVVENTIGWENAIKGLLVILALLNAQIIASPIGLLIAGLILLIAILDDLHVYSTGKGKSLFGVLMEQFPELEEKFNKFFKTIKDVFGLMKALFKGDDMSVKKYLDELGILGTAVVAFYESVKASFDIVKIGIDDFFNSFSWLTDAITKLSGVVSGDLDFGDVVKSLGKSYWENLVVNPFEKRVNFVKSLFGGGKGDTTNTFNIEINGVEGAEEGLNEMQRALLEAQRSIEANAGRDE